MHQIRYDGEWYEFPDSHLEEVLTAIEDARRGNGRMLGLVRADGKCVHLLLTATAPITLLSDAPISFNR